MTAKEEATGLVDRFWNKVMHLKISGNIKKEIAKQCALICLAEMIKVQSPWANSFMGRKQFEELEEIKQEIIKL